MGMSNSLKIFRKFVACLMVIVFFTQVAVAAPVHANVPDAYAGLVSHP